ncbi:MAG: DUF3486 family protein [Porticoccaceae bacterium]|nr:DUF3486 family protein [Porticoccaceae bacterium]
MPRISTVDRLPLGVKVELKRLLRARQMSQMDVAAWLNSKGYDISKSAVNRYSMRLEEEDARLGIDRDAMAAANLADVVSLFEELAEIRQRETEILGLLRERVFSDNGIGLTAEADKGEPARCHDS